MTMVRWLGLAICLAIAAAGPAVAQSRDRTLADIRQQLTVLNVEIQKLKRELSTTGGVAVPTGGDSLIQRVDAIEQALQSLTEKTEELQFRIDKIVEDGSNRIGDLAFRLCELETDCDISELDKAAPLGGIPPRIAAAPPDPADTTGAPPQDGEAPVLMAVREKAAFDRAKADLEAGRVAQAADGFAAFLRDYPGGPLTSEAHFHRGIALKRQGMTAEAARAFLDSFSGAPEGRFAPEALHELGLALAELGQTREACVTLGEVSARFPDSAVAPRAAAARDDLVCN